MATIKLKKPPATTGDTAPREKRAPVRGQGSAPRKRPTLAQAQTAREEREARYQEQLRQRFGDKPPAKFVRRDEQPPAFQKKPAPRRDPLEGADTGRSGNTAFGGSRNTAFSGGNSAFTGRGRGPSDPQAPRHEPQRTPAQRNDMQRDDTRRHDPRRDDTRRHDTPRDDARRQDAGRAQPPRHDARRDDPRGRPAPRDDRRRDDPRRADATRQDAPRRPAPRHDDPHHATAPRKRAPSRRDEADDEEGQFQHAEMPGSMRLSKRMSELGIASRREADEWIAKGWVRVDDVVVSELGSRVMPDQRITVDAKAKFQQAQRVTVLLNKPVGYVSGQAEDGYEPAVVLVTPQNQWREDQSGIRFLREHLRSLAPAGRLDIDSVGLLVLTQDGRIAKQLIGEDSDTEKEYLVRVQTGDGGRLPDDKLALLNHGLELDGEPLRPAQVEWVNDDQLRFVLKEGKKRQIRRMCEAVGLKVLGLKRVRIGKVMLGDLPPGQWRYLRPGESFA
jgi:23S rRNA pseudouridine2604 synthase